MSFETISSRFISPDSKKSRSNAKHAERDKKNKILNLVLSPSVPNGNSGGGGEDPGDLIEKMMRSLLSKEMLYPAIKVE